MSLAVSLPILIPLLTAALLITTWGRGRLHTPLALAGSLGLFAAAAWLLRAVWTGGVQVTQLGSWPAPYGISLVADTFSALMVMAAGTIGLLVTIYCIADIDPQRKTYGFFPLYHIMLMGICGAFLTGDLFNLFVWFEVLLIASFVLLGLGGERGQLEGGIKYVTLNLLSSAFFLAAVGLIYALAGTLNMADLAQKLGEVRERGLVTLVAMLFFIAFGIKAAVFPLFYWLPASYHTPPTAVSAIFAGLLTKVGVYAMIRVFTLLFIHDRDFTHTLILVVSGLTMLTGVLGAVAQSEIRRLLSFHIISQIGYMILGLGLYTPLGLAGSIFHILHNMLAKTNLFLISGVTRQVFGTGDLKKMGDLYRAWPLLGVMFWVPALALAGVPPLSGFFPKFMLVRAGLETQQYAIIAVALVVSLLTYYSMVKIWTEAFWKPSAWDEDHVRGEVRRARRERAFAARMLPIVVLAAGTVAMGLFAEGMFALVYRAAEELLDPSHYINAVLKETS